MPSSAARTFTDPDDYAACIRNSTAEMTITGRGVFNAKLTRIDLHRLWMQRFADNLPRVAHTASRSERVSITFRTQPGPTLLWGDAEMLPTNIVRHGESGSPFQRSSGSVSFAAMSLPVEDAVQAKRGGRLQGNLGALTAVACEPHHSFKKMRLSSLVTLRWREMDSNL
jgi:hypothetical protein